MGPLVKRRINPEAITFTSSSETQSHINGTSGNGQNGHSNGLNAIVPVPKLGPEAEASAAKAAGLTGRRIFVKLNKDDLITVSWKQVLQNTPPT